MQDLDTATRPLADQILAASAEGKPLRIRGGGSKDFYGQAFQGEVLDMRALAGISSYEPSELVVTVRAGTRLAELEAVLAEQGQALRGVQALAGEQQTQAWAQAFAIHATHCFF